MLFILFNLSAFFSGSETAFFSIDDVTARRIAREGGLFSGVVAKLLERKERILSTVLLGNEVVNVAISSISASIFMDVFGERWVGASVFVTTLFLLIYGEFVPKVVAVKNNVIWARLSAPFIMLFSFLLAPLRILLESVANAVTRIVGSEEACIKEADFKVLVDEAKSRGLLEERERRMIYRVFRFTELQVKEIMVPEPDVFMVEINTSWEELKRRILQERFSKVPVYEKERDNVIGYIKITDLLPVFKGLKRADLKSLIRPCYFVPETKPVQELLREFQTKGIDMAMVINEYGALEGLVTLEDILEELVGEIWDEYDRERVLIQRDGDGYIVDALCPVEELCSLLNVECPDDIGVETAGGFVLHLFGRVPKCGESVEYKGWRFTVVDTVKRRIRRIRVERDEVSGDEGSGESGDTGGSP